jgi:hypothetical protein
MTGRTGRFARAIRPWLSLEPANEGQDTMRMSSKAGIGGISRLAFAAAVVASSWTVATPGFAGGLFDGLAGAWRGDGSISWSTGETERIRCTATYEVTLEGNKLVQNLTCATDSTRLIVKSDIRYNPSAGAISGTWAETTYGVNGRVSGSASASSIKALVQSGDRRFTARVNVATNGDNQTVSITSDLELREVNVKMQRRG